MAVEAGVDFAVRERIINEYVRLRRAAWPNSERYVPMLLRNGSELADGVLRVMDLMGDEPEVAAFLHWVIARHVNDPHDWADAATVVDLLRWRRDGTVSLRSSD